MQMMRRIEWKLIQIKSDWVNYLIFIYFFFLTNLPNSVIIEFIHNWI